MKFPLPIKQQIFLPLFILILSSASALANTIVEKTPDLSCAVGCNPATCSQLSTSGNPETSRLILLMAFIFLLTVFLYQRYKHKIIIAVGVIISTGLITVHFIHHPLGTNSSATCEVKVNTEIGKIENTFAETEFNSQTSEFEQSDNSQSNTPTPNLKENDEILPSSEEFAPASGEFSSASDEFTSLDSTATNSEFGNLAGSSASEIKTDYNLLYQLAALFTLLILISYLIKYENFRKTKGLFLLASVVYLGFYKGACPCMILSLNNTILAIMGQPIEWVSMVWFIGLIPLTYFFGKIWCGWLCHLGGLQELLFKSPNLDILKSRKAQDILRYTRIAMLVILVVQLLITKTNIYIHYDPFKVAFNLFSANITGYVLLAVLLLSSVLIYRPFCRAFCPVGLILGWVALIPGARKLSKHDTCVDCVSCSKSCQSKAMTYENKQSQLNTQDCILCGDCISSCKKKSLYVVNLKR